MVVSTELILLNQLNKGRLEFEIVSLNGWPSDGASTTLGSGIDVLSQSNMVVIQNEELGRLRQGLDVWNAKAGVLNVSGHPLTPSLAFSTPPQAFPTPHIWVLLEVIF
ncbi:hypothetical protein PIB30_027269 [Stylosanthes scabra]|uniref:Uncharacterized protein n=1 Tax=Stylosanthes scabra TaxID=79078 RepID=A0ABU6W951_9FABA|nr:hypothetical protein [Stylosanthes scabra]